MTILLLLAAAVPFVTYWLWPRPTLVYRRGAIYQRNFEEFFVVEWSCKVVSWQTLYVKFFDAIIIVDSNNISLAELKRHASPLDTQRLLRLLNEDLEKFRVTSINNDRVTIKTPAGGQFDVELEDTGWQFRHSQKSHPLLTDLIPWEIRRYRTSRAAQIES